MFTDAQKALFSLVCIPCFALCFLLFRIGKRPLLGNTTFTERMEIFYSMSAACLLGLFLFHTLPNTTVMHPEVGFGCIMIAFFVVMCFQKMGRVCHDNDMYVESNQVLVEIRHMIDRDTMTMNDYHKMADLESDDTAEERLSVEDERAELQKRRRLTILTLVIIIILCLFEGFFLVVRQDTIVGGIWALLGAFYVQKLLETLIVCVAMLHSFTHTGRNYAIMSGIWCAVTTLSTVPLLADMPQTAADNMTNHYATHVFYALAGGVLFWIALYYVWIDKKRTDKRDTLIRLFYFGLAAALMWVTGFFT
jgi:hypothetical protein